MLVHDIYSIMWGYKPILDTDAFDEKVLNQWITERADDLMFRFGSSSYRSKALKLKI